MQTKDNAQFHIVHVQGWIQKDNKFLLAQRSLQELQAPGAWSIPGGKVDDELGERVLEQALKKEILEEVGIVVKNTMQIIYNDAFVRVDGSHVVTLVFLCDWESGEARGLEDTERVQWFTLEELKNFSEAKDFLKKLIKALVDYLYVRS